MLDRRRWLQGFLRDQRGNAAVVFAFVLLPLLAGAGLAIDSMLAFTVEERLQKALDAAGLAAGQTSIRENIVPDARAFFRSNFDEAPDLATAADPTVVISPDGTEITLTASATMQTRFMRLFGQDSVTVNARSVINRVTRGMELVLVLDVTYSMVENNKIGALQSAANEMLNIIYGNRNIVDDLWVGVVPYIAAVNVGKKNKSFLRADDRVNVSPSDFNPDNWEGCVLARLPRDQTDDPPSVQRFSSYFFDDVTEPRVTGFENDWGPGRSPQVKTVTAREGGVPYLDGWGPNAGCPSPITPLVRQKSQIVKAIADLLPWQRGGTQVNTGLVWGWRVISPRWRGLWDGSPSNLPLNYNTPNMDKVIVVLTDGKNQHLVRSHDGGYVSPYSAYENYTNLGIIPTDAQRATDTARNLLDQKTQNVCNAMKGNDIIIYTISLGPLSDVDQKARDLMRGCASEPELYFHSPDGATLRTVFRAIGNQLNNLRIKR